MNRFNSCHSGYNSSCSESAGGNPGGATGSRRGSFSSSTQENKNSKKDQLKARSLVRSSSTIDQVCCTLLFSIVVYVYIYVCHLDNSLHRPGRRCLVCRLAAAAALLVHRGQPTTAAWTGEAASWPVMGDKTSLPSTSILLDPSTQYWPGASRQT